MGGIFAERITAHQTLVDDKPRPAVVVQHQGCNFFPAQVVFDFDRGKAAVPRDIFADTGDIFGRQRENRRNFLQQGVNAAAYLFGNQHGLKVLDICGKFYAVTVIYAAARRNQQTGRKAVAVGQKRVFFPLINLQIIQTADEDKEQKNIDAEHNQRPFEQNPQLVVRFSHTAPPDGCTVLPPRCRNGRESDKA